MNDRLDISEIFLKGHKTQIKKKKKKKKKKNFFPSCITIRIDTLWAQLLLEFSTDHFETMHICFTWSEDVHLVLGLSSYYF